jgi:hypothetical protein
LRLSWIHDHSPFERDVRLSASMDSL